MTVFDLRTENQARPLGLAERRPRFSRKLRSDKVKVVQTTCRLQGTTVPDFAVPFWDSGVVADEKNQFVPYDGPFLAEETRYWFRVTVTAAGEDSGWSEPEWFETALNPAYSEPGNFGATPTGRLAARTQTAHILALVFDLVPEALRSRTIADLVQLLAETDGHLTTGFLGAPAFCNALSESGRLDLAYDLLLKEDYPSWLFQVGSAPMNSFNHLIFMDGKIEDGAWTLRFEIPPNTSAILKLPGFTKTFGSGTWTVVRPWTDQRGSLGGAISVP